MWIGLLFLQILLPLILVRDLGRGNYTKPRDWFLNLIPAVVCVLFITQVSPWGHLPYALRILWPLVLLFTGIYSWRRLRREEPDTPPAEEYPAPAPRRRSSMLWAVVPVILFAAPIYHSFAARRVPEPPLDLDFPLRNGIYLVGHGGSHKTLNYHNVNESQRYALDIGKLNWLTMRATGLQSKQLRAYAIWGDTLYSPCDARVNSLENRLPDYTPPQGDPHNPAGNHVELETDDGVRIFLAHMQKGSVRVKIGDRVRRGDPLGKVGNSGNTSEPHLHIHAVRGGRGLFEGKGVPLTFRGRFLVRNDLIW